MLASAAPRRSTTAEVRFKVLNRLSDDATAPAVSPSGNEGSAAYEALRLGVDIGGTFTDFTVTSRSGEVQFIWKEETTPQDLSAGVLTGLDAIARHYGLSTVDLLGRADLLVHGTTAATNSVIERNGPSTGLLCTKGFRDVLYFRDGLKPERFNIHLEHPREFVDRYLRIGVRERLDRNGSIVQELVEDDVREAAAVFRKAGVRSVAIAFLWSMINPDHELRAAEILREELPDCYVVTSYAVMPEIREWERTSATVLSAYILPVIDTYLRKLEDHLRVNGLKREMLVMQVNGGCAPVAEILRRPVYALHSGPAAAPAAAVWYAQALGADDLITVDMGGTSFDICLITGGRAEMTRNLQVDGQPIGVPAVDVTSIGAGGGSIAWIDPGGALRVGPKSAGAVPGPVCYGAGGTEPTVTDANLVLGFLAPDGFLGGRKTLDLERAQQAINDRIAVPLGLTLLEAASGIVQVVDANMVGAIRAQSLTRGIDPRKYVLVVGGGAGGAHACGLARQLGIRRVFVPREAGTFCSFGMTVTDVRHDYSRTHHAISSDLDLVAVDRVFEQLEVDARTRLLADGFSPEEIELRRFADARYPGQVHDLTIPVPLGTPYTGADSEAIEAQFHAEHDRHFAYSRPDLPVELVHWRVSSTGSSGLSKPDLGSATKSQPVGAVVGERNIYFPIVRENRLTPIYQADKLSAGDQFVGPAVVQAATTTLVINPGDEVVVLPDGGYAITIDLDSNKPTNPSQQSDSVKG